MFKRSDSNWPDLVKVGRTLVKISQKVLKIIKNLSLNWNQNKKCNWDYGSYEHPLGKLSPWQKRLIFSRSPLYSHALQNITVGKKMVALKLFFVRNSRSIPWWWWWNLSVIKKSCNWKRIQSLLLFRTRRNFTPSGETQTPPFLVVRRLPRKASSKSDRVWPLFSAFYTKWII